MFEIDESLIESPTHTFTINNITDDEYTDILMMVYGFYKKISFIDGNKYNLSMSNVVINYANE
mgnify:CR=1 FL=1